VQKPEARSALEEELDLLPAYVNKSQRAFRKTEKEMKEGACASVCSCWYNRTREGESHRADDRIEAEEAQALCCWRGHQPRRRPGVAAVNINNNTNPLYASVELRRAHNAPQQHVRCLFWYTKIRATRLT
jgi:hypothetical protein